MLRPLVLFCLLLGTSACSVIGIRLEEEASYQTLEKDGSIEIRQYPNYLSAETTVPDENWKLASNKAFRRLAGYIFGDNRNSTKISMTAPVLMSPNGNTSQNIEMSAPVFAEKISDGWKMSFVLPSELTLENAPEPLDPNVILKEQEGKKFAVVRFSGLLNESKFSHYSKKPRDLVAPNPETWSRDLVAPNFYYKCRQLSACYNRFISLKGLLRR